MRIRIIAADDDALMMELMERHLAPFCSAFVKVTTLREALQKVENDHFNICLLDLRFEETGKEEALSAIRFIKSHNCAVVVVTGIPQPAVEKEAKEAGCDYFVRKDGPNFGSVLRAACAIAVLHVPSDTFKSSSFLEHVEALRKTVAA